MNKQLISLIREWVIGFSIAYFALFIAIGFKGNLFVAVFYLPVYWGLTITLAIKYSVWSLLAIDILPFIFLAITLRIVSLPLRYRVAGYLAVAGLLGLYNLPKFIA